MAIRSPWRKRGGKRILAVSSGGGHWVELLRVITAFEGHEVVFVTVSDVYKRDVPGSRVHVVNDATRWDKAGSAKLAARMFALVLRERPDVVFTTGAAPGAFAIIGGRFIGARTIWLDSIANIDEMSMSGRLVGRFTDLWLTQWPHLSRPSGPTYAGQVF